MKRKSRFFLTIIVCGLFLSLGSLNAFSFPKDLRPRKTLSPPDFTIKPEERYRLTVKFKDELKVRAQSSGNVASLRGTVMPAIADLRSKHRLRFKPLIKLPEQKLIELETNAAERSGRAQPDLAGMMIVEVSEADNEKLRQVGKELQALDIVEYAHMQLLMNPPPADIPPTTPDLTSHQTYFELDPGLDVNYAQSLGYKGGGVRLSDCEYGWVYSHEDLVDKNLHPEPGQTPHPNVAANGWDEHGTAVVGEICAVDNGYGVTGMVPDASVYTYSELTVEDGSRRVASITNAIADSAAGDIVLLEMQRDFAPAETDPNVWTVVKAGVDAGIIVVSAAGNGNRDLDGMDYETYMSWGDSGAIMVGGGSPDLNHDKHAFSTFGNRVNVQGWYGNVFTLGYGEFAEYGGDKNQRYLAGFSGTSGASPFIASACVAIQDKAQDYGRRLTPLEMRYLLISTGIPQGTGGHVGPFPDLRAALELTDELALGVWVNFSHSGTENGSFRNPYNTLAEGVIAAPVGGYVNVIAGQTNETITITKAIEIINWGGTVTIGQ